jgi:hypothetical protein
MRKELKDSPTLDCSHILRPVAGAAFSLLDDRPVLFSESAQKIYELNQMAAYIWCGVMERKPAEAICEDLTNFGLDRVAARDHVHKALQDWFTLGLLEVDWELSESHSFTVILGRLAVHVRTSSEWLKEILIPLFGQTSSVPDNIGARFEVAEIDCRVHIFHDGACVAGCAINELVPTFKALITEQMMLQSSPDIAFHAACLLSAEKCLLVSGRPGAGKTTLAVHLTEVGFRYAADDIVLISPDGRAMGVPFAPTIKAGAWAMIEKFRPELSKSAVHIRSDGKRVRYLKVPQTARSGSVSVGWIIFIERQSNVPAKLTPLGQLETMSRLIEGSYAPGGKMTHQGFQSIKRTLANAKSFDLHYSDAAQARDALVDLCHG